jgi:hypothetical protein
MPRFLIRDKVVEAEDAEAALAMAEDLNDSDFDPASVETLTYDDTQHEILDEEGDLIFIEQGGERHDPPMRW